MKPYNLSTSQAKAVMQMIGEPWPEGYIAGELKLKKKPHTSTQRGKYWACLHEFGAAQGYTRGEVESLLHNAILCEAYGTKTHKAIGQHLMPIPNQRSSSADRDEYSELIETLVRVAADHGHVFREAA